MILYINMAGERETQYQYSCKIRLGEVPVCFCVHFKEAYEYFLPYEMKGDVSEAYRLYVPEEEWREAFKRGAVYSAQTETSLLTAISSQFLFDFNSCVIHAVAFSYQGKAWLITGAPGAGKSTQIRNLQELCPKDFSIICGDRPVLTVSEDKTVVVYPSPWNGKENWHGADPAPLEGIICLERGEENRVTSLKLREAIIPFYKSIIFTADTENVILKAAELETRILQNCSRFRLISSTVPQSSELLYHTIFQS